MNEEAYKKAIELIMNRSYNADAIVIKLAQENPALFVEYATGRKDWMLSAQESFAKLIFESNGRDVIQTIKAVRIEFNLSLKEAKDIVDSIR